MKRLALPTALIAALLATSVAMGAGVTIYKSSFKSKGEVGAIQRLSGSPKRCKRDWRNESALGVTAKKGPVHCAVATPVQGDSSQPDQIVRVVAKLSKKTDKKVRKNAYLGVTVRAAGRGGYEFRVFPKARRYALLRNGKTVADGRDKVIEGLARDNRLQIEANGNAIVASANGKELASLRDRDVKQVKGRRTGLTYGNAGRSRKGVATGSFDKLKVQIPVR